MIRIQCSACGQKLKVKDEYAGRRTECPGCGSGLTVPLESTLEEKHSASGSHPAPPTIPAVQATSAIPRTLSHGQTTEGHDGSEPYKPSTAKVPRRRLALTRAAMVVPLIALAAAAMESYARLRMGRRPSEPVK